VAWPWVLNFGCPVLTSKKDGRPAFDLEFRGAPSFAVGRAGPLSTWSPCASRVRNPTLEERQGRGTREATAGGSALRDAGGSAEGGSRQEPAAAQALDVSQIERKLEAE